MKQLWMILSLVILISGSFPAYAENLEQISQLSHEIKELREVTVKIKQEQVTNEKELLTKLYALNQNLLKEVFTANLQSVNTYLSVVNVVIIIILGILGVAGFFGLKSIQDLKSEVVKEKQSIEEALESMREKQTDLERAKKEAEKDIAFIRKQRNNAEVEMDKLRDRTKEVMNQPSDEEPTGEIRKQLNEFIWLSQIYKAMGAELESEDYVKYGKNSYYNEEYDSALQAFEEAIKIDPKNARAWFNKGLILGSKLGKYAEALDSYRQVIDLRSNLSPSAQYNIACTYARIPEKNEALSQLQKAIEIDHKYKKMAMEDEAFIHLKEDEDFKKIVGG